MIKSHAIMEIKKGDRAYQLHLPSDSPIGEVHDVLHEMKMHIITMIGERAQQEVVEPKEPQTEVV